MDHDVHLDLDDRSQQPRLTCRTEGCHEVAVIRQPSMYDDVWADTQAEFLKKHPTREIQIDEPVD